jgi:hypothetical protein
MMAVGNEVGVSVIDTHHYTHFSELAGEGMILGRSSRPLNGLTARSIGW